LRGSNETSLQLSRSVIKIQLRMIKDVECEEKSVYDLFSLRTRKSRALYEVSA
jgi:hypothetical protein